ncbi:glycosyltransferase family 2 protein [Haemophilus sp. oral taxon 036]|uniref:glycosyltransferase family 2 protein n=1 Tax=Haemophilus sp. oral taxon 036 TaxID=712310 RepID=UPI000D032762|nr:glycosyltransferase family 2 protein [Haemophilus sp. oral taxon 036]AVM60710.1 rhamnosyltransferase [Haemophilus sp. oral taxon 036]
MIYAVIVCYEPTINIITLMNSLIAQGVYPIVIDNSEKCFIDISVSKCIYYKVGENIGIAAAQNIGISIALSNGAKAIVFFDQDSMIPDNLISTLYSPILEGKSKISVPIYINIKGDFFYQIVKCNTLGLRKKITPYIGMKDFHTNIAISSGSMVSANLFENVGYMEERLFIDHVDTEWFLRAASKGYRALVVTNAIMEHTIGDNFIDLKVMKIPVHSPIRRYYRVRNAFLLLKYKHIPKLLALREVLFSFFHQFIIFIFSNKKKAYFLYFCKAICDGVNNKTGKIN